jgi:uncharacterized membrane protein
MRALVFAFLLAACSQPADPPTANAPAAEPPAQEAAAPRAPQTPQEALAAMPSWETARAAGVDFRAVGQEPGWLMDIYTRGIIKLSWDYGERYSEFGVGAATQPQEGVQRYEVNSDGVALIVTIRRAPCNDAMSGAPYPSTVEIVVDGRTLSGCGRSV